jgi:prephenate dehydratase
MAVFKLFDSSVKTEPTKSFRTVFEKVAAGTCEYGVVPIENSLGGIVYQVWDCLYEFDLAIIDETYLKIEHCLIVNPGTTYGDIKKIYSHYQPVLQCEDFLKKHSQWSVVDTYDTAGSVKIIKELPTNESKNVAAIASERSAYVYNMVILEKSIQDSVQNVTRFIVITKTKKELGNKFTAVISLENKVGALAEILQFALTYNVNLTSIHSRPNKDKPFTYIFFMEGVHDESVRTFVTDVEHKFSSFKLLGVYNKSLDND